jgi:hypothetical protein
MTVHGLPRSCGCFAAPYGHSMKAKELGMDDRFAEVSVLTCKGCGQDWLRYFYEVEAFTASGRWYLGAITPAELSSLNLMNAKSTLEGLSWYYHGGSYYSGLSGKSAGEIPLIP